CTRPRARTTRRWSGSRVGACSKGLFKGKRARLRPAVGGLMNGLITRLERIERGFVSALIASSIGLSVVGVFHRYVLSQSLAYVEEVAGLMMAAVIVIGSSLAITCRDHIRVELLIQVCPRLTRWLNSLAWLTVLTVSGAMAYLTYLFVAKLISQDQIASSV